MTKGKVVLVPFPFDDLSTAKARPAVCLTDPIGPYQHVILAFITSRIPPDLLDTDWVLDTSHTEFVSTGLRVSSTLRLHRLMTVAISLIQRELGELSPGMQTEVANRLRRLFAL
jgi:mRNA interferase MazF